MKEGFIIFYVTCANGSVPICGANVSIAVNGKEESALTDKSGKTPPFAFCFFDDRPHLEGYAEISSENFEKTFLRDIKLYRGVTVVRIVNLDRKK